MNITVVGSGCAKCKKLEELVREVVAEKGVTAAISKMSDIREIAQSGVLMTPGLIIDGKIKVAGKLPSKAELGKIIESSVQ